MHRWNEGRQWQAALSHWLGIDKEIWCRAKMRLEVLKSSWRVWSWQTCAVVPMCTLVSNLRFQGCQLGNCNELSLHENFWSEWGGTGLWLILEIMNVDGAGVELACSHLELWSKIEDFMQNLVASIFQSLFMCKYSLITSVEPIALLKGRGKEKFCQLTSWDSFSFTRHQWRVIKFSQCQVILTKSGLRFECIVYFN